MWWSANWFENLEIINFAWITIWKSSYSLISFKSSGIDHGNDQYHFTAISWARQSIFRHLIWGWGECASILLEKIALLMQTLSTWRTYKCSFFHMPVINIFVSWFCFQGGSYTCMIPPWCTCTCVPSLIANIGGRDGRKTKQNKTTCKPAQK